MNTESNSYESRFSYLTGMFSNYYYQCCMEYHGSEEEILKEYVRELPVEVSYCTIKELDEFIALGLSKPELEKAIIEDLGSYYYPGYSMDTVQEVYAWLHWVRDTLAKYTAEKAALENPESPNKRA